MVWQYLLNVQWGAINSTLQALKLPAIPFLSSPQWAKPSLILIHMWAQGNAMVIFLATLQDVPRSLRFTQRTFIEGISLTGIKG